MENKQLPSKKNLLSIQKEKLIRKVDYDCLAGGSRLPLKNPLLLDLEILQRKSPQRPVAQRVLVSVKPRAPAIKTLYIAEKSRFNSKKTSDKSGSRLAIGDHSSLTATYINEDNIVNSIACGSQAYTKTETDLNRCSFTTNQVDSSKVVSKCSQNDFQHCQIKKCYTCFQPSINIIKCPKADINADKRTAISNKVDISTLILKSTSDKATETVPLSFVTITTLIERLDQLESRLLRQEMVFRSINPNLSLSSSDEECKDNMKAASETGRPGCSYIQQYSHVPKTSAFQRYSQQAAPLSPSKTTTLDKEHNSEQYGRDFTAYDGITSRSRRQSASVPGKRDDIPKLAAERVHKIRHKLNPVRDYRLMDTVHYLAQGEFAPRDDGIKLTPSREAVLSDIIWEDVCRTHWPTARLGRRIPHNERFNTRCELQRLIDSLLRERVSHVERRRRRHYRIIKLNHRHESCRPLGKTGDIIVASHKNKGDKVVVSDHTAPSGLKAGMKWKESGSRKIPKSQDQLESEMREYHNAYCCEECPPGPSYAANRTVREPTCCFQTSGPNDTNRRDLKKNNGSHDLMSCSSSACKAKSPRLVVKKDVGHRKYHNCKDDTNYEHYILLPTLVVRTPSNMKRQKKFNQLYHRILSMQQTGNVQNCGVGSETATSPQKRDIGLNINITLSNSSANKSE